MPPHAGHATTEDAADASGGGVSPWQERLGWAALQYPISPSANRLMYMLGGLTFVSIVLLMVTGMALDQFYSPTPIGAHDSVIYIITRMPLGAWLRGLHYWAATVGFISVFLHLGFVFWRRSYGRPREVTWLAGVGLFVVLFVMIFTGTALRGDQEAVEAVAHAVAGAKMLKGAGSVMMPDFAPSTTLVTRLHNLHVSVLPIVLLALVGLHFMLIRQLGIHTHEPKTSRFTQHLTKLTGAGLVLFAALGILSAVFPPALGQPGIEGVEVTKPFWPFLWIYAVENTFGMVGMLIAPGILFGFLALVPLLDRGRHGATRRPAWLTALAVLILVLYIGGIIYGAMAPQKQHIM